MTLELAALTLDGSQDPELQNFRRRFFWTLPLRVSVTVQLGFRPQMIDHRTGSRQNPCAGTSSALLNLLDMFWNAIRPVNSTTASSSK